jgi:hypothetical protein
MEEVISDEFIFLNKKKLLNSENELIYISTNDLGWGQIQ